MATLKQLLNHTEGFLGSMRNLSTMGADMKILTEVELDTLEKLINTTQVLSKRLKLRYMTGNGSGLAHREN